MNLLNTLKLFPLCLLISSCKPTPNYYKIESEFNSNNQTSTIYLIQNKFKLDSLSTKNWYGKDSIEQIDSIHWKYFYSQRCGTGCSVMNQMLIRIEENKLKKIYDSLAYYTYHSFVIHSINNTTTNCLIEYDSIHLMKKNSTWYFINKKNVDGKLIELEQRLRL